MRQIKHNLLENCSSFIKYVSLIKFYGTGFWVNIRWKAKICILIGRFYGKTETIQLYNISYPFWQNTKLRNSKIYAPSKQHLPEIMIQSSSLCYGKVLIFKNYDKQVRERCSFLCWYIFVKRNHLSCRSCPLSTPKWQAFVTHVLSTTKVRFVKDKWKELD